jgi:superfamily II DNA or RNA helicase
MEPRQQLFNQAHARLGLYGTVLIQAATGAGKTKLALDLIESHGGKWTIFTPTTVIIRSWEQEITKWDKHHLDITIMCYASSHKFEGGNVVADEAHRLTQRSIDTIVNPVKLIALSATIPSEKSPILRAFKIDQKNTVTFSLDDAVDAGLVADYKVWVAQIPMGTERILEAGNKFNRFMTSEQEAYKFHNKQISQAMNAHPRNDTLIQLRVFARNRFIYNLKSKTAAGLKALGRIAQDKKTLVFCGSIAQAVAVCGKNVYHSKSGPEQFERFCRGEIKRLACVQMLNEGVTVPDLDYVVILSVQAKAHHLIQRVGRLLRRKPGQDKLGKVIVLLAADTKEVEWFSRASEGFDQSKILPLTI